jgi:hypothetical protein
MRESVAGAVAAHAPSVCILVVAPGQHVAINTFACKHHARVRPSSFPPRKQRLQSITAAVSITIDGVEEIRV